MAIRPVSTVKKTFFILCSVARYMDTLRILSQNLFSTNQSISSAIKAYDFSLS